MRTTIRIDDDLLREAKESAAASHRTLTELVQDALRETLTRRRAGQARGRVTLLTVKGRGPRAGVDLDDSAALLDHMDRSGAAP